MNLKKTTYLHILPAMLMALSLLTAPASYAREKLLSSSTTITTNPESDSSTLKNILDSKAATAWHCADNLSADAYLEFDLGKDVTLAPDERLVIEITRCNDAHDNAKQVTGFKVETIDASGNAHHEANAYLLFRGPGTVQCSSKLTIDHTFRKIRLTASRNNHIVTDANGHRLFGLAEIQIHKIQKDQIYTSDFVDWLHLTTDYYGDYKTAKFTRTMGIIDPANHANNDNVKAWCEWSNFKDGVWTRDAKALEEAGIEMPNFSMLTNANKESTFASMLPNGQERQPTHTVQHILYAVPGDVIALYPYYQMRDQAYNAYLINYSHWYDWKTGGHITHTGSTGETTRLLDLAIDPSGIYYTDNNGYFGATGLATDRFSNHYRIYSATDWIRFTRVVNGGTNTNATAEIMADLDFSGFDCVSPIGWDNAHAFGGKIEGHGHTIRNLHMIVDGTAGCGLIGRASNGCEVRNIIIDSSCSFQAKDRVGAIIGGIFAGRYAADGKTELEPVRLSNIKTSATIYSTDGWYTGGLVGEYMKRTYEGKDASGKTISCASYGVPILTNISVEGKIVSLGGTKNSTALGIFGPWNQIYFEMKEIYVNPTFEPEIPTNNIRPFKMSTAPKWDSDPAKDEYGPFYANNVIESCYQNIISGEIFKFYNISKSSKDKSLYGKAGEAMTFNPVKSWLPSRFDTYTAAQKQIYDPSNFGTIGTFFCPRDPSDKMGAMQSLPLPADGSKEYVIAADFSHNFNPETNIKRDAFGAPIEIIEPIIHYRHIFRIRDGVTFAEEFSGSAANNADYISKNIVNVTAREADHFQIRLDSPVPAENGVPSKYYYKITDDDYRRVCTMQIHAYNADTDEELPNSGGFRFSEGFKGEGSRYRGSVEYLLCANKGNYYRMLECKEPPTDASGNPIKNVKILITGNDKNGDPISVFGSEGTPLVVMQYNIRFETYKRACFITEKELYDESEANENKYKPLRKEFLLQDSKMRIVDSVDFDEYRALEDLPESADPNVRSASDYLVGSNGKFWYKWPLSWGQSNYSFGYDFATADQQKDFYDCNEYLIASHCSMTPFHYAASLFPLTDFDKTMYPMQTDKGLYDRKYYETRRLGKYDASITPDHGYFYYNNAATDPGVMVRLTTKGLCPGSAVHVSAWISEMSQATFVVDTKDPLTGELTHPAGSAGETANVAFNFIAVAKDDIGERAGERIKMHTYVTGYVPFDSEHFGHWMYAYYTFIPNFTDIGLSPAEIDHYEIELDNNCKNSTGADYAIDDITLYIEDPKIEANQLSELCDLPAAQVKVKVESEFDVLLQSLELNEGTEEKNDEIEVYYTFIDKALFDKLNDKDDDAKAEEAYEAAVIRYDYDGLKNEDGTPKKTTYGTLKFNTCYLENDEYNRADNTISEARRWNDPVTKVRKIVFNTIPTDANLASAKKYYIAMSPHTKMVTDDDGNLIPNPVKPGWEVFNINNACTMQCVFQVKTSTIVKVDGEIGEDGSQTDYCENQQPVIQVNLYGMNTQTGEVEIVQRNAFFDWYDGTASAYAAENQTSTGIELRDALKHLRYAYPDAENLDEVTPMGDLTDAMIEYLKEVTVAQEGEKEPKVVLHKKSFVFPPLQIPPGESEADVFVLALPIERDDDGYHICANPTEVKLHVKERSPYLAHGFHDEKIVYPSYLFDVPLRVSLDQLTAASCDPQEDLVNHPRQLVIPIREVRATGLTDGATQMRRTLRDDNSISAEITLVWTDDPEYTDLGSPDQTGKEEGLAAVGVLTSLVADAAEGKGDDNLFTAAFYNIFRFKEGYTYRLRFPFEEDSQNVNKRCPGHDVFTIKVVPEYLKWVGDENLSFNNDANWERVSTADIHASLAGMQDPRAGYFTDGSNPHTAAFAPLDFTRVVIPQGSKAPHLVDSATEDIQSLGNSFTWTKSPSERVMTDMAAYSYPFEPFAATADIQFDMAAFNDAQNVGCRPWYANTCNEIHFRPESRIIGQGFLDYEQAWVDLEMTAQRWYTAATPLQEVYAGDFYLPTETARQKSELFKPITWADSRNNRFAPAVFQRSWNVSQAIIYEVGGVNSRDVAVQAAWSHVYNDVEVQYGAGSGFSIKTDPSEARYVSSDKVLFRLPKDDKSFLYYEKGTNTTAGNYTTISRGDGQYKLNEAEGEIHARTKEGTRFFLVGNPLMSELDMKAFLLNENNAKKILPKYWIVTEKGQTAGIFDENSDGFVGDASGIVAPMQGFFVEAIDGAATLVTPESGHSYLDLELEYSPAMAVATDSPLAPLRVQGRGADAGSAVGPQKSLTITATCGDYESTALVIVDENCVPGFVESRDVEALDNCAGLGLPSIVYAAAGNMASSVCTRPTLDGTSIGLLASPFAADKEKTVLTFTGVDESENLALYNSNDGTFTDLYEGMQYAVAAPVSGLFIRSSVVEAPRESLGYSLSGRVLTVKGCEPRAQIFAVSGYQVARAEGEDAVSFTLEPGVYLLEAADTDNSLTAKIIVR